jgi:D-lactate dehydrogenase
MLRRPYPQRVATIVVCVETAPWESEQLREAFAAVPDVDLRLLPGRLADHLDEVADAEVLSTFIHSRVDAAALDRMMELQLVATRSTGTDHLELKACAERGISVANVPTYGENTVAEHAFALILGLSRRLIVAEAKGRRADFDLSGLQGFDLKGRTLGVVGGGRIGLHVIRIARAFGMEVLVSDPYREELLAEVLGFAYVDLDELLERSHVVTLHAPAIPATHHLIDAAALARMRPGALLVNTARGALVDTEALVAALDSGHLGGAGLDVFEGEEHVGEDYELLAQGGEERVRLALGRRLLADRDDVILTPHNAFNSREAVERIAATTAANVAAYKAGEDANVVG